MPEAEGFGCLETVSPELSLPGRRLSHLAEQAARCTTDCCGAGSTVDEGGAELVSLSGGPGEERVPWSPARRRR